MTLVVWKKKDSVFGNDDVKLLDEFRQVLSRNVPNDSEIHLEIVIHNFVPHPRHFAPRKFRMLLLKFRGDLGTRFADDLDQIRDRQVERVVAIELVATFSRDLCDRTAGSIKDVSNQDGVTLQHRPA